MQSRRFDEAPSKGVLLTKNFLTYQVENENISYFITPPTPSRLRPARQDYLKRGNQCANPAVK
jgi:hypothetical protein